jgi:hypothetical protein
MWMSAPAMLSMMKANPIVFTPLIAPRAHRAAAMIVDGVGKEAFRIDVKCALRWNHVRGQEQAAARLAAS